MSSDNELNWMTSPQYLCGVQTGLTSLNGTVTCCTTVVVTHCICFRWEYSIENGSKEIECEGLNWTNSARPKVRRRAEMIMTMQRGTQIFSLGVVGWVRD